MMMKPAPTSSLEMPQTQFMFQFFIVAFDDPAQLGQADQVRDFRFHRQGRQPILGGFGFSLPPLDEQPLLGTRFRTLLIPMRRTDPHSGELRTEPTLGAGPPGDALPRPLRQPLRQRQDRNRPMPRIPPQPFGRLASTTPGLFRPRSFPYLPDRGRRAHAENVEQAQCGDTL